MIRTIQRKSGPRFEVYAQLAGKKVFVSSHGTEKEAADADERYRVTQRMIASGELPPEVDLSRTFTQAADEWIASLRKSKARKADGYSKRVEIYLKPAFGDVPITRVTNSSVMGFRDEQSVRLAPATVNGSLITLSSAFTYFKKRGWIASNPVHGVERIEDPDRDYAWIHTREEMTRLLLACNDELRDIVVMALATGLRFDEVLHVQYADIDLRSRLISIHRGRNQGTVKKGRIRRVPILDSLLPVLQARMLKRNGAILVFPGEDGKKVRSQSGVATIFKLAVKRAQLDERLTFHCLRHTFASHWMMSGGCIFKLSKVLGHSSVKITEKIYAHLAPDAFDGDLDRVSFVVPSEPAKLYELKRDTNGKIVGRGTAVLASVG